MKIFVKLGKNTATGKFENTYITTTDIKVKTKVNTNFDGTGGYYSEVILGTSEKDGKFAYFTTSGLNAITDELYDKLLANAIETEDFPNGY